MSDLPIRQSYSLFNDNLNYSVSEIDLTVLVIYPVWDLSGGVVGVRPTLAAIPTRHLLSENFAWGSAFNPPWRLELKTLGGGGC